MAEPTTQEHIRWALMALYLVRNKLNAIGLDANDTAMVNLAAAEETLRSIDGVAAADPAAAARSDFAAYCATRCGLEPAPAGVAGTFNDQPKDPK